MHYSLPPMLNPIIRMNSAIYSWSISKFLVLCGTGLLALFLSVSVIIAYKIASTSLNSAYSRNAQMRAQAQAYEINQLLIAARQELQFIGSGSLTREEIFNHLSRKSLEDRNRYREIAFQGNTVDERFVFINIGSSVVSVPIEQALVGKPGIFPANDQFNEKPKEYVHVSDPVEVVYPAVPSQGGVNAIAVNVIRLTMPVFSEEKVYRGQLTLSIDLSRIRNILSLHASPQSPLFLFPQENESKKSFFFDAAGWLLFQSESEQESINELSVDELRIGLRGDVGRPGFSTAFRPDSANELYWTVVSEVQKGKSGQVLSDRSFARSSANERQLYFSFVPIVFQETPGSQRVIGGIGCFDTSFMFMASTYQVAWTLSLAFLVSLLLFFIAMFYLSMRICKPLHTLAEAIDVRVSGDDPSPLDFPPIFSEISRFQQSLNILLLQLQIARNDTILREGLYENDWMGQNINLEKEIANSQDLDPQLLTTSLYGIVGAGQAVSTLRQQIQKASRVLADVLIIGETGTGKELAAEAVHAVSHRANGPFISINCGALDENLLMDALFGHVKGAFSEALTDRQGAFVAASGGTLHLDEIANASPKVQQALLRALSVRRIRPLGSDKEIAFDARIIAATNIDLLQLALAGKFREDLYYRLAVITIVMPPLRHRKEDIIVLVKHFLEENVSLSGQPFVGISRGALEKMTNYDWPGNIRELKNCITRSLAFADGELLSASHILFDKRVGETIEPIEQAVRHAVSNGVTSQKEVDVPTVPGVAIVEKSAEHVGDWFGELNDRQRKAWPVIVQNGGITRIEYQAAAGESISIRTAQYDLQSLMTMGLLSKTGRGPSSRYLVAQGTVI
ncbi:MAG: sigma-54 dependent transcriptional regulator [Proteobacteria bacterium]|nr:sigma-54 dependent transcriptional regulator [Pseudomonadota bacterium]